MHPISLNMPRRITGSNGADSYFLYGPEGQRIAKEIGGGRLTVYLNEVYELVLDAENRTTSRLTLPLGTAMAEILVSDRGAENRYLLLDHLGSPEVILDQDLEVLEQLSFDPWGKRRQQDWSPAEETIASSTPTGFTGHEMDDDTGLINMQARLYDPLLGRFLSADTVIPQPENLQSYNRYSYVLNNPLRYVDPTGHEPDEEDGGPDSTGVAEAGNDNQAEENDDNNRGDYDGDGDVDDDDDVYAGFTPTDDTPQEVAEKNNPTTAQTTVKAKIRKDVVLAMKSKVDWEKFFDYSRTVKGPYKSPLQNGIDMADRWTSDQILKSIGYAKPIGKEILGRAVATGVGIVVYELTNPNTCYAPTIDDIINDGYDANNDGKLDQKELENYLEKL